MTIIYQCPICESPCELHDVVDLNKSCEESRGKFLKLSGIAIYYALCGECGHCFSPDMCSWSKEKFEEEIYNEQYELVDPDYLGARAKANARMLTNSIFSKLPRFIRHMDFGGGKGLLASHLRECGWNSVSYDPFVNSEIILSNLGKFDLMTAYEVFEHAVDPKLLMREINALMEHDGMLLFSTLISDGQIAKHRRLDWWYASPRNGHINLFSQKSLALLGKLNGYNFGSFSSGLHAFFKTVPEWASHLIRHN